MNETIATSGQSAGVESSDLLELVAEYERMDCPRMDKSLGFQHMPEGYALMLNGDHTHFFWLRFDGTESVIDWNKWRVRRSAFIHASNSV